MEIEFFMHMIPPTMTHQEKQVRVVKMCIRDSGIQRKRCERAAGLFLPADEKRTPGGWSRLGFQQLKN